MSYRKLIRSLREFSDELKANAGDITIHEHCPECATKLAFTFKDIPQAQTTYVNCWKCKETIRFRWVRDES